jgi:flagellar motor switch protein FliN/FliY
MSDESTNVGPDDVDQLLKQAQSVAAGAQEAPIPGTPAGGEGVIDPSELEALLETAKDPTASDASSSGAESGTTPSSANSSPNDPSADRQPADDLDLLFRQATEALDSIDQPSDGSLPGLAPFRLADFSGTPASTEKATLDLLRDVELDLKIELGRTQLHLEDVLKLRKGSVVPLDKLAGDPVDVYVNGRLIARGEVLVLNDNFCVRVAELIAGDAVA